jgi:polyribonucleotide nucleotidyltransferase
MPGRRSGKSIEIAHDAIRIQVKAQEELRALVGVTGKREYTKPYRNEELNEKIKAFAKDKMYAIASAASAKHERSDAFKALHDEVVAYLGEELPDEDKALIGHYTGELQYYVVRDMILNDRKRLDGRGTEDIRQLGNGNRYFTYATRICIFTRGETQSLTTVTLGTPLDELLIESAHSSDYTANLFYIIISLHSVPVK